MCMELHSDALFDGWNGPFYPQPVVELAKVLSGAPHTLTYKAQGINAALRRVAQYNGCRRIQSDDGYWWMWALEFVVYGEGRVLVALPWDRDHDLGEGVSVDRAPAVYFRGSASVRDAAAAAARTARALS